MAVLCYSTEDDLNSEFTRQVTEKMRSHGISALSMSQMAERLPEYPKKFFLDEPFYVTDERSGAVQISPQNMEVINAAQKKLQSEYILFVFIYPQYEGAWLGLFSRQRVTTATKSVLIKYPESRQAAYFYHKKKKTSIKFWWLSSSFKRAKGIMVASFPDVADDFVKNYIAEIGKHSE